MSDPVMSPRSNRFKRSPRAKHRGPVRPIGQAIPNLGGFPQAWANNRRGPTVGEQGISDRPALPCRDTVTHSPTLECPTRSSAERRYQERAGAAVQVGHAKVLFRILVVLGIRALARRDGQGTLRKRLARCSAEPGLIVRCPERRPDYDVKYVSFPQMFPHLF